MCSANAETLLAWSVLFWCGLLLLASRNCLCLTPSHMHFPLFLTRCAALNTDNNFWKLWEHLLPPFSPQGLRFPPSVRETWKLWKPAKPLPPWWTTRTLWKTDNYFYLCRLTVAMRSSNENLKSTSLTKKKNTLLNFCLPSEGSLPSLRRGPQTCVFTHTTLRVHREIVPVLSPRPPPPSARVLLPVPLSNRSCVSYVCFPQRKGYWSFISGDQADNFISI